MGFPKNKKEDEKDKGIPELTVSHYREITELYRKFGKSTGRILAYWKAVKIDDRGMVQSVLDWSAANEHDMRSYEDFEPLRGIKYMGTGYLTYMPYNWCTEWIRQWEWWLSNKATPDEKRGIITETRVWRRPQLSQSQANFQGLTST